MPPLQPVLFHDTAALAGIMAQSMYKATAHEDLKRLLSKAQAIDELESTIPSCIERLTPHSYPAYVHVLRVRHV